MSKFKFKLITRVLPLLPPKVYRTKGIQLDFLSKDQIYFSVSLNQSPSIHVDNFSLFFSNLYQNEFPVKFSSPSSQNINFKISNPSILTFSNAFNINFHQPILTITNPKISNPYVITPFKEPLKNKAYSIDFVLHQRTFSIDKLQLPEVTYRSYKRTLSKFLKQVTQALDNIINYFEAIPEANIDINLTNILYDFPDIFISKNLFRPIGVTRAYGMNYAHKYFTLITFPKLPKTEQASEKEKPTRRQVKIRQQEFTNVANDVTAPSIWDLIFVILQPPLDFSSKNLFLPSDLYPYQVKGVDFLIKNQHALLADDMGTGKTVMTICALKILFRQRKIRHALILCPPTVLLEWERHLRDWSPELAVFYVKGNANLRRIVWKKEFHVYVSSYDTFSRDVHYGNIDKKLFEYFDVVILDEAHHIRNPQSKRSQAIRKLKPRYRWALTGTPIQNRIEDLLSIFDFVYPDYLSTYAASDLQSSYFTNRIKEAIKPYFLRRRKSEVLSDLPPKQRQEFWIVMNEHQRKVYESAEAGIRQEVIDMLVGSDKIDEQLIKTHIFSKIQRLKQIINFPPNSLDSPKFA